MPASGANEPTFPTQFHVTYGAKKGDETYDDPNITLNDISTFDALYKEFQKLLETKYDLQSDCQRYHTNAAKNYFARHLNTKVNAIAVRIAWSVTCWDMRAIQIAQDFAQIINQHINHCDNPEVPALKTKDIGYKGY
jgi:voltage-gated potassium channel